jgi:hypothetical protein
MMTDGSGFYALRRAGTSNFSPDEKYFHKSSLFLKDFQFRDVFPSETRWSVQQLPRAQTKQQKTSPQKQHYGRPQ